MENGGIKYLKRKIFVRFSLLTGLLFLLALLSAGTFDYWQVFAYFTVLLGPMVFVTFYFLKHNPEFLARRLRYREKEKSQKIIVTIFTILFFSGYVIAGFDRRFGWSDVSLIITIMSDFLVILGYIFVFFVFRENSFASRVVEVEKDQAVISSGPYSFIRHPMYAGIIIIYLSTPFALGSFWSFIPFASIPFALVLRILNEEKILSEQLPGYREYCSKVKYRLIPKIW